MAHLSNPRIVREGTLRYGVDTGQHLRDAIASLRAIRPRPDYAIVTGDLTDRGLIEEYQHLHNLLTELDIPYRVAAGGRDDVAALREVLLPQTYGGAGDGPIRYVELAFPVPLLVVPRHIHRPWPARIEEQTLTWLETTLSALPERPTLVAMDRAPSAVVGAKRLATILKGRRSVERIVAGMSAAAGSAGFVGPMTVVIPSVSPQVSPEFFPEGAAFRLTTRPPSFALHEYRDGFFTTIFQRFGRGIYAPTITVRPADAPKTR